MNRISTLFIFFIVALLNSSQSQTIYLDNGSSKTYTLKTGDSLYIAGGTFTGTINDWENGGKVTIATGARFAPAAVNGFRSKYVNYGTITIGTLNALTGFGLVNHGTVVINGNADMNGNAGQVWTNTVGGNLIVNGNWNINNAATITNTGTIEVSGNISMWSAAVITNKREISAKGNIAIGNGQVINEGAFSADGSFTIGGNTSYTNTCRTIAGNGLVFNNGAATIYNSGLLWAAGQEGKSSLTNNATIINTGNAFIKTVAFTNYGSVKGNGYLYILGASTANGTIGTSGTTTDVLRIYTVNRKKTTQIFDNQWGTVNASAVYATFSAPDTVGIAGLPCSVEYAPKAILPVVWNEVSVSLVSDVPVVNWSASFDEGTRFEIERSENGSSFITIATRASQMGINRYSYSDKGLPASHAVVVYYRVKAFEPDGTHKYSDVKVVRFSKAGTSANAQAWPNPFASQLNVNYNANQKTQLTISIYNVEGKLQVVKTAQVNTGNNSIVISEAAKLPAGVYVVRVANHAGDHSSMKLIKQ